MKASQFAGSALAGSMKLNEQLPRIQKRKIMIMVLMGVTGSGKTTVGKLLAAQLGWSYYDADDFHSPANVEKMQRGVPLEDSDRQPWLETLRALIRNCLERGENAVLACSALKRSYRDYLLLNDQVRLIYLKGSRELIEQRLFERRGHFMDPKLLASQFEILEEPEGDVAIDIALPAAEIVKRIKVELDQLVPPTDTKGKSR